MLVFTLRQRVSRTDGSADTGWFSPGGLGLPTPAVCGTEVPDSASERRHPGVHVPTAETRFAPRKAWLQVWGLSTPQGSAGLGAVLSPARSGTRRPSSRKTPLPWNKTLAEEGKGTCRMSSVLAQHISTTHVNIIHYLSLNPSIKLNRVSHALATRKFPFPFTNKTCCVSKIRAKFIDRSSARGVPGSTPLSFASNRFHFQIPMQIPPSSARKNTSAAFKPKPTRAGLGLLGLGFFFVVLLLFFFSLSLLPPKQPEIGNTSEEGTQKLPSPQPWKGR